MIVKTINDYTATQVLGMGPFHTLYLVEAPDHQQYVIKLIQLKKTDSKNAISKVQAYLPLKHPNIVNAREFFFHNQDK
jgi:hypothetical protein